MAVGDAGAKGAETNDDGSALPTADGNSSRRGWRFGMKKKTEIEGRVLQGEHVALVCRRELVAGIGYDGAQIKDSRTSPDGYFLEMAAVIHSHEPCLVT